MPGVNYPAGDYLLQTLTSLDCRLTNLETAARLPTVAASTVGSSSTYSSTSYGTAANSPVATATIGPSGLALVTYTARVTPGSYTAGESCSAALCLDGGAPNPSVYPALVTSVAANITYSQTGSLALVFSGLTPGQHTWSLEFLVSTAGVVATFANQTLVVQPL